MKTYKQFVVESNTARDNLYEFWGAAWNGLKIAGNTAKGLGYGAGLGVTLSQVVPWALEKAGKSKQVSDFTGNIPIVGPKIDQYIQSRDKNSSSTPTPDPKDPKPEDPKPKDPTGPKTDTGNPYCNYKTHRYVRATNKCVLK
jgi:hypothetical protein